MTESGHGFAPAALESAAEQHETAATEAIADGNIMATSTSSGVTCRTRDVGNYQGSTPVRHENAHITAIDESYAVDNDARVEQNMHFLPPEGQNCKESIVEQLLDRFLSPEVLLDIGILLGYEIEGWHQRLTKI